MLNPNLSPKEIREISKGITDTVHQISTPIAKKVSKPKPKIGIYALTSCYGCQLSIAMVSKLLDIVSVVNIKSYYMVSSNSSIHEKVDIAFVEGSVSTEQDLEELKEIRKNAKILVAIGACAINGGVQSWAKENMDYEKMYSEVYGKNEI
ncbi:MAG: hypothetical protein ACFFDW_16195, partial [Candidatus Thorarchaeota archaeon]